MKSLHDIGPSLDQELIILAQYWYYIQKSRGNKTQLRLHHSTTQQYGHSHLYADRHCKIDYINLSRKDNIWNCLPSYSSWVDESKRYKDKRLPFHSGMILR